MNRLGILFLASFFSISPALAANSGSSTFDNQAVLLKKISLAAKQLAYAGTYIHQHGNRVDTVRVFHISDLQGEHEKIEAMDGPAREIIRNNDQVLAYLPEAKIIRMEKSSFHKRFPALIPEQVNQISEYYAIKKGEVERVAGYDCQLILLEPKDNLRYGHRLCYETNSGLLLKASMLNDKHEALSQFSFTQVMIGGMIDKESLKPKLGSTQGWRYDYPATSELSQTDFGWEVKTPPPGFQTVKILKRNMSGKSAPVLHLLFSDGLVAISVFIEPILPNTKIAQGVSHQGAINIFVKQLNDYQITVLGEVPSAAVIQLGNAVSRAK